MALSQQYEGLMLVPWFNREEWDFVYSLLYEQTDIRSAQTIIKMWKQRTPQLPSAVECTLILLDAYLIEDHNDSTRLLLSASIMRFLNLCCSQEDRQGTFTQKAKSLCFPEWMVNMRHDIAHSHSVPSLELLTSAVDFCFRWIQENYWERQRDTLESYSPMKTVSIDTLKPALKSYCRITSLYYTKNCVKNPKDVKRYEAKLKTALANYRSDQMDSVSTVLSRILEYVANEIGESRQSWVKDLIVDTIVSDGGFMLVFTRDALYFDVESAVRLPKDFISAWSNLIDFVFEIDCLQLLLESLIRIANNEVVQPALRRICALWVSHLFERLLLTKLIKQSNVKEKVKKSVYQRFPNMRTLSLFEYHFETPTIFSDVRRLKKVAEDTPTVYTLLFIESLLELCGASAKEREFVDVIRILVNTEREGEERDVDLTDICRGIADKIQFVDGVEHLQSQEDSVNESRFVPVKDYSIFENCSLGILRHQVRSANPYFANELSL